MSFFEKFYGSPNIEKLSAQKDIPRLIKALIYRDDAKIRQAAAKSLGEVGDARAVESLIAALKDESEDVRIEAVKALHDIDAADAVSIRAVEPLIAALKDENANVRFWVAATFGKRVSDERVIEPLITTLKDNDKRIRGMAANALSFIGDERAIEPLIATFNDDDNDVRRAAILAIGDIGDARAVEPLISALIDDDEDMRWAAANALNKIGDERAIKPLIVSLSDKDDNVRKWSASALGKIGDSYAIDPLIAILKDNDKDVRAFAVEALGQIGEVYAAGPIIDLLRDENENVRRAAENALVELKWQPSNDENGAKYWIATGQINKCIAIGAPAVLPLIVALKNSEVCNAAARALDELKWQPSNDENGARYWIAIGQIDKCIAIGAAAVTPLIFALEDKDWDIRESASNALRQITDPQVADLIAAALKNMEKDIPELVDNLVELYDKSLKGEGWYPKNSNVTAIGEKLNKMGGMESMREAHALFAQRRPRAARNLEILWDGIGSWRG